MTVELNTSLLNRGIDADKTNNIGSLQFQLDQVLPAYSAGKIVYDPTTKSFIVDTGYPNVRQSLGRERHIEVYNGTGVLIPDGSPVSVNLTFTDGVPNVVLTDPSTVMLTLGFAGVATMDIPDGETGVVTPSGTVGGVDTSSFSEGFVYAAAGGTYTQTRPLHPTERLLIGAVSVVDAADGEILVAPQRIPRLSESGSYTFTSADAAAGVHYRAGLYDWALTSATLNQGALSVTHGTAGVAKAAHVGVVPNGPGTVDAGQVGLQVTGTLDSELGVQVAAQTAVITDDITTLTADVMAECLEKFSGQVTLALYIVSGTPTAYSITLNYGFSKYEDFANIDATVVTFNAVWEAGANDSLFNIELLHHKAEGWTYAASGFVPGDSAICEKAVDQAIDGDIALGQDAAYKRSGLATFVEGSGVEGVLIRITTGANNSIRSLDMRVSAVSEELS